MTLKQEMIKMQSHLFQGWCVACCRHFSLHGQCEEQMVNGRGLVFQGLKWLLSCVELNWIWTSAKFEVLTNIQQACEFPITLKSRKTQEIEINMFIIKKKTKTPALLYSGNLTGGCERIKGYFTADETLGTSIWVLLAQVRSHIIKSYQS